MYFASRMQAGRMLAAKLLPKYLNTKSVVMVLDDGGAMVGAQVARELHCPLMYLSSAEIMLPREPQAIAGITDSGTFVYNKGYSEGEIDEMVSEYFNLIEQEKRLGGVCLNRGCIPSKALLHATKMITEARDSTHRGITFTEPQINLEKLRAWKNSIVQKLSQGISQLAQKRGVEVLYGRGHFEGSNSLRVETEAGQQFVTYEKAIVAVGSKSAMPKAFDLGNPRIMTSSEALEVEEIPENLLVVGGGYIGMELGTVYASLGSKVVVVEALDSQDWVTATQQAELLGLAISTVARTLECPAAHMPQQQQR